MLMADTKNTTMPVNAAARNRGRKRHGRHRKGYRRPVEMIDRGTPEAIKLRAVLAGPKGDPSKTTTPIEAMHARHLLTDDQYNAARRYEWLYSFAVGKRLDPHAPTPADAVPCCANPEPCENCSVPKIEAAWHRAAAANRYDRRAKDALDNVVVFHRWPRWFLVLCGNRRGMTRMRGSDQAERDALFKALDALVKAGCVMRAEKAS